jgi:hypothetical protein
MHKSTSNIEMLRVLALSIICTPHPFLDFSGFAPAQEKLDINCSTKQQISNDDFFSFDGSAPVQD